MRQVAILVTGMSGVGESTALAEVSRRGFATVDTDDVGWIEVVDGEPLWREPLIDALLNQWRDKPLFVQGTVINQSRFYERFDAVVLLSAPLQVLFGRTSGRWPPPSAAPNRYPVSVRVRADASHLCTVIPEMLAP